MNIQKCRKWNSPVILGNATHWTTTIAPTPAWPQTECHSEGVQINCGISLRAVVKASEFSSVPSNLNPSAATNDFRNYQKIMKSAASAERGWGCPSDMQSSTIKKTIQQTSRCNVHTHYENALFEHAYDGNIWWWLIDLLTYLLTNLLTY